MTVENTGESDAYVRTIYAFEAGSKTAAEWNALVSYSAFMTEQKVWSVSEAGTMEIDGNNYVVFEYVYNGAKHLGGVHENGVLPAGETTYPGLCQVYLKHTATNEDMIALDGNGNGTYDILVLSQAVQTEGFDVAEDAFDAAFPMGTSNENVIAWFENQEVVIPEVLSSYDDLVGAKGSDGSYVIAEDVSTSNILHFGAGTDVSLNLNGKTVTAENRNQYALGAQQGSVLRLTGDGTVDMGKGFYANKDGAEIVVDGGTYKTSVTGTLNNIKHASLAQNNSKMVINGGTFTTDVEDAVLFFATSNSVVEINGGFFENTVDKTPDLLGVGPNKYNTNRIIIKGGTFVNYNPLEDNMAYKGEWPADYAQFSGPWILVWDGYKVVPEAQPNGDVWYTVVPE